MATSTEPQVLVTRNDTDQRFVLDNVGWQGDEAKRQLVSLRALPAQAGGGLRVVRDEPRLPLPPARRGHPAPEVRGDDEPYRAGGG